MAIVASALAGQSPVRAQGQPLNIQYGFGDLARPNCWTPVLIESNLDILFQGEAAIYPAGASGTEPGEFRAPVTLTSIGAEGEKERFWLYVRPGQGQFRASAYLDGDNGIELFSRQALGAGTLDDSTCVFLIAYGPSGRPLGLQSAILQRLVLTDGSEYRPYRHDYQAVPIVTRHLPNLVIGYDGVDALVLLNPRVERDLREDQIEAITQFVEQGGRLTVFVNRNWQEMARSRLAEILPARLGPLSQIRDAEPLRLMAGRMAPDIEGELFVPAMLPVDPSCRVELACDNRPVIIRRTVGMGSVVLVGLDSESDALQRWPAAPVMSARIQQLKEYPMPENKVGHSTFVIGEFPDQFVIPGGRFGSVQFVWAVILMTIGYIFVAGPLLHLLLRGMKRLHWSWPAYMGLSLIAAGASFAIVSTVRNRDTLCRTMSVADFPSDGREMVGRSLYSLRFPDSALYDVALQTKRGAIALRPSGTGLGVLPTTTRRFRHSTTLLALERLAVKSNQSRHFTSQWRAAGIPLPVVADVRQSEGTASLSGTLIGGDRTIREAVLVADDVCYVFSGGIKAGKTVDLDKATARRTVDELRRWADKYIDEGSSFGMMPTTPDEVNQRGIADKVYRDVRLASFYEKHRRNPPDLRVNRFSMSEKVRDLISRREVVRALDLTHVLDAGQAVLVGMADLDVPDGLTVNGRSAHSEGDDRLVVFRQVIPIRAATGGD